MNWSNEEIIIEIRGDDVKLGELQNDVNAAIKNGFSGRFAFTPETLQGLINKIVDQNDYINELTYEG